MTIDAIDAHAVLSALIDRETVDADELARVLEEPAARALLVDFVRLRQAINADDLAAEPLFAPRPAAPTPRRLLRPLAAALLVAGAGLGGLWLGERRDQERPPTPSRVVSFTPGVDWNQQQTEQTR
jgi:hypothetical protein